MKKIIGLPAACATIALLAMSVFASTSPRTEALFQDQCTPENKLAWYNEFRQTFKTDQAKAYDLASKYLACPAVAGEEQITNYLKNFVTLYQKSARKGQVADLVYNKKDYAKAFELGRQVLAEEPDYLKTYIDLGYAGYFAAISGNTSFLNDSLNYSTKALELIQAGKAPDDWKPFSGKDETIAWMNFIIGTGKITNAPAEAIPFFIKAATIEGPFKKSPQTYSLLGQAYEVGVYAKQFEEYNRLYKDKPETPESKLALENINQVIDRVIDAYARAVSLAGTDPKNQKIKDESLKSLTTWYKFRNNDSEAGLNEMVASILSKPLPPQPTPITSLPAASPGSTSGAGSTNTGAGQGAAAATPKPSPSQAATKPGSTTSSNPSGPGRP
jgi:hypothetical protein